MARKAAATLIIVMVTVGVVGVALLQRVRAAGQTWIVTSTGDSGPGTLRSFLANATTGDTITFDSSVFPPTSPVNIKLASELPHITQGNLTIDASGAGVILNGSGTPADTVGLVVDSENNTIKGLQILNFSGWGIRLTANANHNTIGGDRTIGTAPSGEGNIISANGRASAGGGITLSSSSNNTISGNNITNNTYGIWLENSTRNTLIGNTASNNSQLGIVLVSSNNSTLTGNNASNNSQYGIFLVSSNNSTLTGNNASNNNIGIYLHDSSNNTIFGNYVATNEENGINLNGSSNNTISRNKITINLIGIYFENSSNNTISGNNITNNGDGIWLDYSSNNTILGNNITNNRYGIWLSESSNNKFYNNTFIDNVQHVHIKTSGYANFWDNGYPSGGNYWSDYTDVDQYSGPDQNEPESDEIWDHPYIIDENNQDNYPIVPEFPSFLILPLLMMATLLAAVVLKWRRKPKNLNL